MSYETLIYEKTEGVGIITNNRPAANNAINMRLAEELTAICANINRDEETRVVIITGAGEKAFSVGVDLNELSLVTSGEQGARLPSVAEPVSRAYNSGYCCNQRGYPGAGSGIGIGL